MAVSRALIPAARQHPNGTESPAGDVPGGLSRRTTLTGLAGLTAAASAAASPALAAPFAADDAGAIRYGEQYKSTGRPLDSLTRMLGVCCVTSSTDGVWGQHDRIKSALKTVGATWIRSGIFTGNKKQVEWLRQLNQAGIKLNAIMGDPEQKAGNPEQLVALIASSLRGGVQSMEGANEWNLRGGSNWVSELRTHQTRLYRAAKSTAATRGIPVVMPALGMRQGFEEFGNQSKIMDWGNIHLYTGGFAPGYRTDEMIRLVKKVSGGDPLIITETGWHNARHSTATHNYTPEAVAGTYAPRLLLEYFIRNVNKLSIYELFDDRKDPGEKNHEAHFGLLRNNGTPKPAFESLANMNKIMKRQYRTEGAAGAALDLRFDSGPPDLRSALVSRKDGRFLLFLWRTAAIYDPNTRKLLNPSNATVTVDWSSPKNVRRYAPAASANALSSERTTRSVLSLKGELQILEVSPG
ncbi:MAG: hypothetical protein V9G19_27060 [Tetrasphaera sp.]